MPTIHDMLAKSVASISRQEAQLAIDRENLATLFKLAPQLPDLPFENVSQHAYKARLRLTLVVELYADACELLDKLLPLPAVLHRDSCCCIVPADSTDSNHGEKTPIFPAWVKLENVTGPSAEVCWYTDLPDGTRCQVEVKVKNAWEIASWSGRKTTQQGTVVMKDSTITHHLNSILRIKSWRPLDGHTSATIYWKPDASIEQVFGKNESRVVITA